MHGGDRDGGDKAAAPAGDGGDLRAMLTMQRRQQMQQPLPPSSHGLPDLHGEEGGGGANKGGGRDGRSSSKRSSSKRG